jgi:hypothetical protein
LRAWKPVSPSTGSTNSFRIFSGVLAATSSMSIPPSEEAITTTCPLPRSTSTPTYSSRAMLIPCSISRRLTSRPPGPVCGVTRVMPRMALAASCAPWAPLTTFTPPPLPRPPAWIWALTTTTSLPVSEMSSFAARSASPMPNTAIPRGTGTLYFRRISLA